MKGEVVGEIAVVRDESLPLHLKYRPKTFEEFVGNEATVDSLVSVLGRTVGAVRSFLFSGPSGTGKTTLARIVGTSIGCAPEDFNEFNVADVRGIDTIREIRSQMNYRPLRGKIKVYLLDEAHMLTREAQNALLKMLEDVPAHVRFILCTTEPEKLIKTILSRCSPFTVSRLPRNRILKLLNWVCTEEGVELSKDVIARIIDASEGSPRTSLVLLDKVIDLTDDNAAFEAINAERVRGDTVIDLCKALIEPFQGRWARVAKIVEGIDDDPEKVRYAILTYLGKVLLSKDDERVARILDVFTDSWMYSGKGGMILACYLATKV